MIYLAFILAFYYLMCTANVGYHFAQEIEYFDDPDDDDELHEFRLTTLTV